MPSYTENALVATLNAVDRGDPIRRIAHNYSISRTTLQHRLAGQQTKTTAHIFQQKLSPIQESRLTEWICIQDILGLAPTYAQIRIFVSRIFLASGSATGIGKHWLEGFLHRNPRVKTLQTHRIDTARINEATTEIIQAWFPLLDLPAIKKVI